MAICQVISIWAQLKILMDEFKFNDFRKKNEGKWLDWARRWLTSKQASKSAWNWKLNSIELKTWTWKCRHSAFIPWCVFQHWQIHCCVAMVDFDLLATTKVMCLSPSSFSTLLIVWNFYFPFTNWGLLVILWYSNAALVRCKN